MTVALLTASGQGTRMGQDIPKQFLHVKDKPVIIYTLERFQNNPQIDAIILVTLPNWFGFVWAYLAQLEKECPKDTVVMIHDGNRPMVDNNIISDSLAVFKQYGSAVAVIPCTEAIFKSEDGKTSTISIPREALQRTQTPHTYTLEKLLWAHQLAKEKGITNTAASCTLMHALGETVYFSRGSEKNFKLTTLDDLEIFNAFLAAEKNHWLK